MAQQKNKYEYVRDWKNANKSTTELVKLPKAAVQDAFTHVCNVEYSIYNEMNKLQERINRLEKLKRRMLEAADQKKMTLLYPDQLINRDVNLTKMQHYFEAERKTKNSDSSPSQKAVISADTVSKEG
jgi:hypothetical protein